MTTSTTSIDIMGLQAAYANLHTDQERDYFMQRYHAVISSFGGKTSYDVDKRPLLVMRSNLCVFFFSSRRRHTRFDCDWSSDVCSSDLHDIDVRLVECHHLGGLVRAPKVRHDVLDLGEFP